MVDTGKYNPAFGGVPTISGWENTTVLIPRPYILRGGIAICHIRNIPLIYDPVM